MAAPPKPWETARVGTRAVNELGHLSSFAPNDNTQSTFSHVPSGQLLPPALPPRPNSNGLGINSNYTTNSSYMPNGGFGSYGNGIGSYGSGYGSYGGGFGSYGGGFNSYGGYGGFGNQYGGFCNGFNRYNNNMFGDVESRFIQLAEESSRPTFQSIESIVGAVGSVAMMLENTFFAMTSSFRAILGVAENFGRLRSLFAQFWSAFAVFRAINYLIKKLLVLLGLRTEDEFRAWAEAQRACGETNGQLPKTPHRTSSWPALLFLGIIGAVPYIIVKMLNRINSTIQSNVTDPSTWQNPMQALAQYDFQASSPQEVSFKAHQIIKIAPQNLQGNLWNSGWLMASIDGKNVGLVPVNYFKIIREPTVPMIPPANQLPAQPLENQISSTQNGDNANAETTTTHMSGSCEGK